MSSSGKWKAGSLLGIPATIIATFLITKYALPGCDGGLSLPATRMNVESFNLWSTDNYDAETHQSDADVQKDEKQSDKDKAVAGNTDNYYDQTVYEENEMDSNGGTPHHDHKKTTCNAFSYLGDGGIYGRTPFGVCINTRKSRARIYKCVPGGSVVETDYPCDDCKCTAGESHTVDFAKVNAKDTTCDTRVCKVDEYLSMKFWEQEAGTVCSYDVPQTVANYRAWTSLPGVCTNDDFADGHFKSFKWECCDEGRVRAQIYKTADCSGNGESLDDAVPPNGNNVGCTFCEGPPCPKVERKKINFGDKIHLKHRNDDTYFGACGAKNDYCGGYRLNYAKDKTKWVILAADKYWGKKPTGSYGWIPGPDSRNCVQSGDVVHVALQAFKKVTFLDVCGYSRCGGYGIGTSIKKRRAGGSGTWTIKGWDAKSGLPLKPGKCITQGDHITLGNHYDGRGWVLGLHQCRGGKNCDASISKGRSSFGTNGWDKFIIA